MKKYFWKLTVLLLVFGLVLAGCSDPGDGRGTGGEKVIVETNNSVDSAEKPCGCPCEVCVGGGECDCGCNCGANNEGTGEGAGSGEGSGSGEGGCGCDPTCNCGDKDVTDGKCDCCGEDHQCSYGNDGNCRCGKCNHGTKGCGHKECDNNCKCCPDCNKYPCDCCGWCEEPKGDNGNCDNGDCPINDPAVGTGENPLEIDVSTSEQDPNKGPDLSDILDALNKGNTIILDPNHGSWNNGAGWKDVNFYLGETLLFNVYNGTGQGTLGFRINDNIDLSNLENVKSLSFELYLNGSFKSVLSNGVFGVTTSGKVTFRIVPTLITAN